MAYAIQWVRSLLFNGQMYLLMACWALFFWPLTKWRRKYAYIAVKTYCNYVRWSAAWMVGIKSEVRGEIPTGDVIIASKHHSFFDIIMIVSVIPKPRFIMKQQLMRTPIVGYYAKQLGCIPVDRGRRGAAIKKMVSDVQGNADSLGQLVIFPQGTRTPPGVKRPYKVGASILYGATQVEAVPTGINVGVFWPRHVVFRKPGQAIIEFLPKIPVGLSNEDFLIEAEKRIEASSNALMREVGFTAIEE